jgi:hypothetical protein
MLDLSECNRYCLGRNNQGEHKLHLSHTQTSFVSHISCIPIIWQKVHRNHALGSILLSIQHMSLQ